MEPRTPSELWNWVKNVLGVRIPRKTCCEEHSTPFEAFCDAYFERASWSVWKASRGFGGKTFLLSTLALTEQITRGASVRLLGGSGEQSQRIHDYLSLDQTEAEGKFWSGPLAPTDMLNRDPAKKHSYTSNGGEIVTLQASSTSIRGPHPQRLFIDEVDEIPVELIDAAMGQPMGDEGLKPVGVFSSTHQYPDGSMTEVLDRALERDWPIHEWCYEETKQPHGWLDPIEIEQKRADVTSYMWQTEYEGERPRPQDTVIDTDAVEAMFDRGLGVYKGSNGEAIQHRAPSGATAYTGTDWAKEQDWTVIDTLVDAGGSALLQGSWQRIGRRPWPVMIEEHNQRVRDYGGQAFHDETGVGGVVSDFLEVPSRGFDFSSGRKNVDDLLSSYVGAIEDGQIVRPMIEWAYNQHLMCTASQLYGTDHTPDSVVGGALAWKAYKYATEETIKVSI